MVELSHGWNIIGVWKELKEKTQTRAERCIREPALALRLESCPHQIHYLVVGTREDGCLEVQLRGEIVQLEWRQIQWVNFV